MTKTETEIKERISFLQKKLDWIYKSDKKIPADASDVESFVQLSVRIEELEWVLSLSKKGMTMTHEKPLQVELETYQKNKADLLRESTEKFVLIKGTEIIGTFNDEKEALNKGIEKFGNVPFLVKKIVEFEQAVYLSRKGMIITRAVNITQNPEKLFTTTGVSNFPRD